jgi:hypothetical protein
MTPLFNFNMEYNGSKPWSRPQRRQPKSQVQAFSKPGRLSLRSLLVVAAFFAIILPMASALKGGEAHSPNPHGACQAAGLTTMPQAQEAHQVSGQVPVELRHLLVRHESGMLTIELILSGAVTPRLSTLDSPSRVVLDLPNTLAVIRDRRIAVGTDGAKTVRVGMDGRVPPTTRVVVDLVQPLESEIAPGSNNNLVLRIHAVPPSNAGSLEPSDQRKEATRSPTEVPALPNSSTQLRDGERARTAPNSSAGTVAGAGEGQSDTVIPAETHTHVERTSGSSPNAATVAANNSNSVEPSDQRKEATRLAIEVPPPPSASAEAPVEKLAQTTPEEAATVPGVSASAQAQGGQPPPTTAPAAAATVTGVVEDRDGAAVPAANLTLVERTSALSRNTVSDNSGHFVFKDVPPGHYVLRGKAEDMQSADTEVVVVGNAMEVKLRMKVSVEEQITVTQAAPDPVSPDNNSDAVDLNAALLRDLPTDSENIVPLLSNFVAPAAGGTEGISLVVDGVEADQIDDLPASAIKEVTINRNPYAVEFRRPGKARIEITTKHGSPKRYHGHFGIFARDSVFDANNRFAVRQPELSRKLFEGNFGGPMGPKGATFFLTGQHLGDTESAIVNATILDALNQPVSLAQNVPTGVHRSDYLARLDFHPGQIHTIPVFYSFDEKFESNQGVGGFNLADHGFSRTLRGHKFQFTDQAVLSPTLLNTARFLVRRSSSRAGNPPGGYAIDVNGNFSSGPSQTSQQQKETVVEFEDTAAYAHKNQTFRFGGGTRARFFDVTDQSNFGGTFEFSDLTQFSLGQPYVFRINQGQPKLSYTIHQASAFVQDEIRFHRTLSLVAGLRYDWQSTINRNNSVAPRLALAYSPGDKTVFRAGAGLFYEYLPKSATEQALLLDNRQVQQIVITNPSYPNAFVGGTARPPSVVQIAPDLTTPYLVQASIGIERELSKGNHLVLEYQTLRGLHLFRSRDVNAPLPLTGVRPNPNFFNINQVESTASMRSNALTLSYRGRVGKHFNAIAQYSFSKTTNDTSGAFSLPADNYNLRPEMGRADFDRRHRLNLAGVINLPGAFRVGTVLSVASGTPFNITTGADNNHDSVANDRPPGVTRNTGDGPGLLQLDLRVTKLFHLWRPLNRDRNSRNLEISVDAFNAINHANYPNFVGVMTSPLFGRPNAALPARTLQMSLGYRF